MSPARERWLAVGLCVLGSALVLLASSQRWVHAVVADPGFPRVAVDATGRTVAPGAAAIGLVGLAGAVALLVTRRVGRVVTGVVLTALGAVVVVASVVVVQDPATAVADAVADAVGRTGQVPTSVDASAWPWVSVLGGVILLAGGLLAAVRGARWPVGARRYEAAAPTPGAPAGDPAGLSGDERSDAMWKALDRGEDPTDPGDAPGPPSRS